MADLRVSHRGFSLTFPVRGSKHTRVALSDGRNIYQFLFEKLIDREVVNAAAVAAEFRKLSPTIHKNTVHHMMKKIEAAARNPKNRRVSFGSSWSVTSFVRVGHGGKRVPRIRRAINAPLTAQQVETSKAMIVKMLQVGYFTRAELRQACMKALKAKTLGEKLLLGEDAMARLIGLALKERPDLKDRVLLQGKHSPRSERHKQEWAVISVLQQGESTVPALQRAVEKATGKRPFDVTIKRVVKRVNALQGALNPVVSGRKHEPTGPLTVKQRQVIYSTIEDSLRTGPKPLASLRKAGLAALDIKGIRGRVTLRNPSSLHNIVNRLRAKNPGLFGITPRKRRPRR